MSAISRETWLAIGADLMRTAQIKAVAKKYSVQTRTIRDAISRFSATGCLLPSMGGRTKAKAQPHLRKTTVAQDKAVKKVIREKRGGALEWTAKKTGEILKMGVHRTTVARRIAEAGMRAFKPARKESYENPDREKRLALAKRYMHEPKSRWMRTIFLDEHMIVHVSPGKVAHRQLHAGKRFVYREAGKAERFHPDCVSLKRGKCTKGGKGVMLVCAILGGKLLRLDTVDSLLARSEARKARAPRISAKGKVLGRPRTRKEPKAKRRGYDGPAHAVFLRDCAKAARRMLKLKKGDVIFAHQDGDRLHWTEECRDAIAEEALSFLDNPPAYSPDINPPENLFALGDAGVLYRQEKTQATTPKETVERFRKAVRDAEKSGAIRRMTENYPMRLQAIIDAEGGPTRY
jgi:transposase